jgi:hypothetical protein
MSDMDFSFPHEEEEEEVEVDNPDVSFMIPCQPINEGYNVMVTPT